MKGNRFILGCDLKVGQSILVNGRAHLITAVEPAILGVVVAYFGTDSFVIAPDQAVEVSSL